tara:strand:- start:1172 stop:1345 length:174 start_codon:yes stop_codon:yes gene_type:complete
MAFPNYRNWKTKILKEIILSHSDIGVVFFDTLTKQNQQNKFFAKVEIGTQKKLLIRN